MKKNKYLPILFLIVISIIVSWQYSHSKLERFNQPPTFGGTDQLDYNAMAYAFSKKNIPGIYITDEYKEKFKNFSSLKNKYIRIALSKKNSKDVRTYAYRPLLYPIVLGISYKLFGYDFAVARGLNMFFIVLTTVMIYHILLLYTNKIIAVIGGASFVLFPNVIKYSNLLLSEIFVVFMVVLFSLLILYSIKKYNSVFLVILSGLILGLLVLSKQLFLYISIPIIIMMSIFYFRKNKIFIGYFIFPYLLIIFSWFSYNIGITENTKLKGGTSGWHDMPSAYSVDYIKGKNRFKIREELFRNYEKMHNVKIRGDINRSLYGKKIFNELIEKKEFWENLPQFIIFKLNGALSSNYYTYWGLFILSLIGIVYLIMKKISDLFIWIVSFIAFGNIAIVSLTFFDGGRLIISTFPMFIILIAITINFIVYREKYETGN